MISHIFGIQAIWGIPKITMGRPSRYDESLLPLKHPLPK